MATLPSPLFINLSIQQGLIHHLDPCPGAVERVTTTPHYDVCLLRQEGRVIHICIPPPRLLIAFFSSSHIIWICDSGPSTRPTDTNPTTKQEANSKHKQSNYHPYFFFIKYNQPCPQAKSSKASFPSPPAPDSRLATGETEFLLLVCHNSLFLFLLCILFKPGLMYMATKDKAKQGQILRNSLRIHQPVWATAGGATYTTAGAVYLTLRYLRRLR